MYKILTIAWKELYTTFTDRSLLLIMIVTPLVISTLIGLAFGGGSDGLSISTIPVAVVNLDTGAGEGARAVNYGQQITDILIPAEGSETAPDGVRCTLIEEDAAPEAQFASLETLIAATRLEDADSARAAVDGGVYRAAIIIPADLSAKLAPDRGFSLAALLRGEAEAPLTPTQIEVYGNSASAVSASIVRSIVEGITGQLVIGSTAINATIETMTGNPAMLPALATADEETFADFACAFTPALNTITVAREPVTIKQTRSVLAQILVQVGSAQAVFFALFTGLFGIQSIYEDRKKWTLQRLLTTPTPRTYILAGKLLGNLLTVGFQLGVLLLALMLIASLLSGQVLFIWGTNLLAILVVLFGLTLCVSGIGVFLTGIARTPEQARIISPLITMGLAILGGAFGFTLPREIAQFSLIYWGANAFDRLSSGQTDILLHVVVLLVQGMVLFGIGVWLFNRRVEV